MARQTDPQMKEQVNFPEKTHEMEVSNLLDREFRVIIIRIFNTMEKDIETDGNSGQWGPCVVAAMNKLTQTTEVLWRKRDGIAAL